MRKIFLLLLLATLARAELGIIVGIEAAQTTSYNKLQWTTDYVKVEEINSEMLADASYAKPIIAIDDMRNETIPTPFIPDDAFTAQLLDRGGEVIQERYFQVQLLPVDENLSVRLVFPLFTEATQISVKAPSGNVVHTISLEEAQGKEQAFSGELIQTTTPTSITTPSLEPAVPTEDESWPLVIAFFVIVAVAIVFYVQKTFN